MSDEPKHTTPEDPNTTPPGDRLPEHTPTSLGRLFAVPLLIVVMIVGCSVVVILLFGWISESREMSIEQLVERIEQGASRFKAGEGEKVLQLAMLPEDKELWQAAQELAERLKREDPAELPPEKKPEVAARLGTVLQDVRTVEQAQMGQKMQQFLLQALGRLGQPESVEILLNYALDESQPMETRRDAMAGLILMRDVPEAQTSWPLLAPLIEHRERVLRIVATMAVGALAEPDDSEAIDTLARASLTADREVMWNATLALGRLGSDQAVPGLLDMLDRAYWENVRIEDESGTLRDAGLGPARIESYLISAMDAAAAVGHPRLPASVRKLEEDPSLKVRNHAMQILKQWEAAPAEIAPPGPEAEPSRLEAE